jgi:hypothetical protein
MGHGARLIWWKIGENKMYDLPTVCLPKVNLRRSRCATLKNYESEFVVHGDFAVGEYMRGFDKCFKQ